MRKNQVEYYKKRAQSYELVYEKAERQADLLGLEAYLSRQFVGLDILEIGCGTGYWTERLAKTCKAIKATDINPAVLEIAQQKNYPPGKVRFALLDFNDLRNQTAKYQGLFGGFIWSHLKKSEVDGFLTACLEQVKEEGIVVFIDNQYVEGSSTPISRVDAAGNQFQIRTLPSGEQYEIIKNFPSRVDFTNYLNDKGIEMEWIAFDYYWIVTIKKGKSC